MTAKLSIPKPGSPVRGSRTGAPIMALLDLLGRRWSMGIIWVLAETGPSSFNVLQTKCESISPGILNTRLKELVLGGLIERTADGYQVSLHGAEMFQLIRPLGKWAKSTWAKTFDELPCVDRSGTTS